MKRLLLALASFAAGMLAARWRPKPMKLSQGTLADIARRFDRSGLGEVNDKDAHPFAVDPKSIRVVPQDRPGVDPSFARGRR